MNCEEDPFSKILEKLFIYAENKDLNINRIRGLIVNPEILRVLIKQLAPLPKQRKLQTLAHISSIYMRNSLNPSILGKRDREILEFSHSIFDQIVSFVMSMKVELSENEHLMEAVRPLLQGYPISCRNIKNVVREVARDFYREKFNSQKLALCIKLLAEFYKNQLTNPVDPKCYFFMYGPNSGIRMINNEVKWTLFKGFYFYISFYIEGEQHEGLSLLNITINNDSFELGVHEGNQLKVKVFSASKLFKLRKIQSKRWYSLKLAYCLKTGIMRNSFYLLAHIDGEPFELRDLPIPSPTMKDSIEELVIGYEFYGRINYAALSRNEINYWPKSGLNNWGQMEGLIMANKSNLKDIFLLYSPLVTTEYKENEIIYQITSRNHAEMLDNTAISNNPFEQVDINYYGGIYTILPFFNILRFYKYEQYPTALQDISNLLVSMFQLGFKNIEVEAVNCQLFPILGIFFNQINEKYITPEVIDTMGALKDLIENKQLKKHFFLSFLWKVSIDRMSDVKAVEKLHRLISSFYFQNFEQAITLKPINQIIWYVLDNFEPEEPQNCCLLHSWQLHSTFDQTNLTTITEQYKDKGEEMSSLIRSILKQLCRQGKYDRISGNKTEVEGEQVGEKEKNILQFLFQDHSICFKKMLMECLHEGLLEDPLSFIHHTQILNCMFYLLPKAELKDQISPIIKILGSCIKAQARIKNDRTASEIIDHIGHQLDRIYMKQYSAIRVRSKSEGLSLIKKSSERKMSGCVGQREQSQNPCLSTLSEKDLKSRYIKLRKEKKIKMSNDRQLFDQILEICCVRNEENGEFLLIDDEYTKIIGSYFKVCCPRFRVKLIEMVRNTVLIRFKNENLPPYMEGLCKFDRIYSFILSEFILKELDPDDPEYQPSENSNYIMRNLFFIVDHIVISLKDDWEKLYLYIVRMIGLLSVATKQIRMKTERNRKDIFFAKKICIRKFVLRVLKHSQKSIENMSNMVFLVYLVVFSNSEDLFFEDLDEMFMSEKSERAMSMSEQAQIQPPRRASYSTHQQVQLQRTKSQDFQFIKYHAKIFEYFKSLEENFLIAPLQLLDADTHIYINQDIFFDEKIILSALSHLNLEQVFHVPHYEDEGKQRKATLNLIKAYFDKPTNELHENLFTLRKIFLSNSKFKEIHREESKGFKNIFSSFMASDPETAGLDPHNPKLDRPLYVCELIGLMISLCIEESIQTQRFQILEESLSKLESFAKVFILVCSHDWLKKSEHSHRNKRLPKNITYHLIHFMYVMMESLANVGLTKKDEEIYRQAIEAKILSTFRFLTMLMTVLTEKVGNPESLEDAIMLSQVMQDVEEYNYFSFEVLQGVITLGQIKLFSTLPVKKQIDVINHPSMKAHFHLSPKIFLENHMKEVIETHMFNINKVNKQLKLKFSENKSLILTVDSKWFSQAERFQQESLNHARRLDFQYRLTMKVWRKIWKRLRLYHYYWSVAMDQREGLNAEWGMQTTPYKHKLSKYTDLEGLRPILEVEPNEPWHVRKAQLDQQVEYRAKNFMVNLYKPKSLHDIQPKTFMSKLFRKYATHTYFNVDWIKHNSKRKGRLSVTKQKIIFCYESTFQKDSHVDFTSFTLAEHRPTEKTWPLVLVTQILRRRYLMRTECVLIEFEDKTAICFNFLDESCEGFFSQIEAIQNQKSEMLNFMKINKVRFFTKKFKYNSNPAQEVEDCTTKWLNGTITNLHYLMFLNKYSGRSCLDPVHYPVLPWVISAYDCKEFIYRDLTKSLGGLGSEARKQFYEKKLESFDPFSNVPPYQYGTHYSSPGVVFNFLVRLSPYTEAARTLQGGRFDLSDRLFSSIKVCWHSVTTEVSDVRELLPEFYYLPEFLINIENHDFGLTQLKKRIHNVELPLWGQDPYSFIANHRRAFESDEVSTAIHNWIDLIFGYKQKGKIAQQNINLYFYLTYENSIDLATITDPVERTSIEAQIIHFGQTPSQIFSRPHPQKQIDHRPTLTEPNKIKLIGNITSLSPLILLDQQLDLNDQVYFFKDFCLMAVNTTQSFQVRWEIDLHREASKENLYHIEDLSSRKKVQLLGGGRFLVVASFVNGDLVVYSTSTGKKVFQKKGNPKSLIYVNKAQNLVLCGCKNGLLEVYEVVYSEKESIVNLLKISEEYMMFPVEEISQGGGFYCISAGNLVIINKITRGLVYLHDKVKMQGIKLIRSFQSARKVHGAYICTNPLYCVVFYNYLEVWIYSINGQFIKLRQVESLVTPVILVDSQHRENLIVIQNNGLQMLELPELNVISTLPVPQKQYVDMKVLGDRVYLVTSEGDILSTTHFHQNFTMLRTR